MSSRQSSRSELEARWRALSTRLGLSHDEGVFAQLNLDRVEYRLRQLDALEHRARHPERVELALWLADAGPLPDGVGEDIRRLVGVLEDHDPEPDDPDGQVCSDADLALLSAPTDEYRRYVEQLGVDDPALRLLQLNDLLGRDSIYRTPEMRAGPEARAQLNLYQERAALTGITVNSAKPARADKPLR